MKIAFLGMPELFVAPIRDHSQGFVPGVGTWNPKGGFADIESF